MYTNKIGKLIAGALLSVSIVSAAVAETKIAVVNLPRITQDSPQANAATEKLEREFASRERELVAMRNEIQDLEAKYKKDSVVMTDSQRLKMERDIRGKKRELERSLKDLREEINIRRNEELAKFQDKVLAVIEQFGNKNGYDLILSQSGIVHFSNKVDVTDEILNVLKAEFKASNK